MGVAASQAVGGRRGSAAKQPGCPQEEVAGQRTVCPATAAPVGDSWWRGGTDSGAPLVGNCILFYPSTQKPHRGALPQVSAKSARLPKVPDLYTMILEGLRLFLW